MLQFCIGLTQLRWTRIPSVCRPLEGDPEADPDPLEGFYGILKQELESVAGPFWNCCPTCPRISDRKWKDGHLAFDK